MHQPLIYLLDLGLTCGASGSLVFGGYCNCHRNCCPDNDVTRAMDEKRIQWMADDLILNRPALSRWHADYKAEFEAYMGA